MYYESKDQFQINVIETRYSSIELATMDFREPIFKGMHWHGSSPQSGTIKLESIHELYLYDLARECLREQ